MLLCTLTLAALASTHQEPALVPPTDVPTWEQLAERPIPAWFDEAKLGIFIHWGVYSVPSWSGAEQYAEWFLNGLQHGDQERIDFLARTYGEGTTYRDLAPLFRAELFDADHWAEVFRAAGARYVVLTAKHHDGFALWPSEHASAARGYPWNAAEVGPRRDLVGELSDAVRAAGLRMGLYYSLPEWGHPLYAWGTLREADDVHRYVDEHMLPQFRDVMRTYRPAVVFSDGEWNHPASTWRSRELVDWLFTESGCPDDLAINDRWGHGATVGFRTPEYSAGADPGERPWAECRGLGRSFGLNRGETLDAYVTPDELVRLLVEAVSGGGGLLLNVGPGADGRIPLIQEERLRQLGAWLEVNGEAIHGTRPWTERGVWGQALVERVDANIDFNWVRNAPADGLEPDGFEAEWTGFLEDPVGGAVRFDLVTRDVSDHATLWLDGERICDEGGPAAVTLEAGVRVPVRVAYREDKVNASCRMLWTRPGEETVPVPPEVLFRGADGEEHGLSGRYSSRRLEVAFTRKDSALFATVFGWPGDELRLPVPAPPSGSAVRLLGLDRDLPWTWSDGVLAIDTSSVTILDLPGDHAWCFQLELPGPERAVEGT